MNVPHRVATLAILVALVGCQGTPSPAPSNPVVPTGSPSAPASATALPATPAPSYQALVPSGAAITNASFTSVTGTSDGFIAAGTTGTSPIVAAGSADGSIWQPLTADDVFHNQLEGIATGPLGWVAAEWIGTPDDASIGTVLWRSDDGHRWLRIPDQADLGTSFPGPVVAGPWGFAMRGQAVDSFGTSAPRVWVSRDGLAWQQMPRLDWGPWQIVAVQGGIVALGGEQSAITTDGITWVDTANLPGGQYGGVAAAAPLGSDLVAILNGEGGALVWRGTVGGPPSQPTLTWQDAGLDITPEAELLTALATGPLGALVLGFDRKTLRPISWASTDGRTWHRADLEEGAFGGGVPTLAAVGDRTFVVLGWFGSEGGDVVSRPWISTDGLAWEGTKPETLGVLPGLPSEPCPKTDPTEAAQLIAMKDSYPSIPAASWPYCFQDRQLVVRGYVGDCGGCGGTTPYVARPAWLLEPLGYAQFWLLGTPPSEEGRGLSISVQIDPRHPVRVPETGAHVRITGHFDDPAAQGCRLIPSEAGVELPPRGAVIAGCRQQFVVTAIKVLAN